MEWYQLISYFFTNIIRICGAVILVEEIIKFQADRKKAGGFLIGIAVFMTVIQGSVDMQQYQLLGIEFVLLLAVLVYYHREKPKMIIFLLLFYEMAVALWEFLISLGMAVLFRNADYLSSEAIEHLVAIWMVRILLSVLGAVAHKIRENGKSLLRLISRFAIVTFFAMITLSGQTIVSIDSEIITNWILVTVLLMTAILVFNLSRQYEIEKEVARLQTEQAELIKNDYQNLNRIYSANARLYHDLHNHMEMMYCYLTQGKTKEALEYMEDLRAPIQEIVQTVWTGDEAIDYLINSKLALMQKNNIAVKTNIEFPRNTNIRSVILTTILGNLLDNAMEAAMKCENKQGFVNLTIRRINNILIIKVENSFEHSPVMKDGVLQSSKEDNQKHGWGLKSARTAAESYDGSLEISFKGNVFCAVATLFY